MKTLQEKLDILKKMQSKMHPVNSMLLDGFLGKIEKGFELKEHDKRWVDDMIKAIRPVNRSRTDE